MTLTDGIPIHPGNWDYLNQFLAVGHNTDGTTLGGAQTLSEVLANGNDANGHDIVGVGDISINGLTGATTPTRYVGGTVSGAPTVGTFAVSDFVIAQNGVVWVCVSAGTPGLWRSISSTLTRQQISLTHRGLLCENYSLAAPLGTGAVTSNHLYILGGLALRTGDVVTGIALGVAVAAAGTDPTQFRVGLYNSSGSSLLASADAKSDASLKTTGLRPLAFTSPYTAVADTGVYAAIYPSGSWGTTQPTFVVSQGLLAVMGRLNASSTNAFLSSDFNMGGAAALPADPVGAGDINFNNTNPFWVGLY